MDFSDVLLTVDFDRTFTGPDAKIPERNLEAVRWFMDQGGTFTINTGRSTDTFRNYLHTLPVNAPLLMYNGSACYENGQLTNCRTIDLPLWDTVLAVKEAFPELNVEIQAMDTHYLIEEKQAYFDLYKAMDWEWSMAKPGDDLGPFIKFAVFGNSDNGHLSGLFVRSPEEERFRQLHDFIMTRWGDKVDVFMAAPRILDVQAKGVSKGNAGRALQKRLGKKILVCVGDAENDIPMMDDADFAFCPADGVIADRYETVCECGKGAVADVIYKKIPEILQNQP